MKKILLFFLLPFCCFAGSIGEDNNAFSMALFSQFQDEENLALSPYGIFSNLALLYFGSAEDTAREIKNALHISAKKDQFLSAFHKHLMHLTKETEHGYELSIANALFPHKGTHFLTRFKEIAAQDFDAKLQSVDFEVPDNALETINNWIDEKTRGKIKNLVTEQDIDKSTRLIVANAVYFQGAWAFPFRIHKGTFHPSMGNPIEVDMLHRIHAFPYYEDDEVQCLALPFARYGTQQPFLECLLILPKKESLPEIEKKLTAKTLDEILYSLEPTGINAHIPKFCFSKKLLLNDVLKKLGIKQAFSYQANFSKIDKMKDLFLNKVLHETYFSFHENGVTAASATTSNIGITSAPPIVEDAKDFIADHPFLFFIVDYHSRAILFMGRVSHPAGCHED